MTVTADGPGRGCQGVPSLIDSHHVHAQKPWPLVSATPNSRTCKEHLKAIGLFHYSWQYQHLYRYDCSTRPFPSNERRYTPNSALHATGVQLTAKNETHFHHR